MYEGLNGKIFLKVCINSQETWIIIPTLLWPRDIILDIIYLLMILFNSCVSY